MRQAIGRHVMGLNFSINFRFQICWKKKYTRENQIWHSDEKQTLLLFWKSNMKPNHVWHSDGKSKYKSYITWWSESVCWKSKFYCFDQNVKDFHKGIMVTWPLNKFESKSGGADGIETGWKKKPTHGSRGSGFMLSPLAAATSVRLRRVVRHSKTHP